VIFDGMIWFESSSSINGSGSDSVAWQHWYLAVDMKVIEDAIKIKKLK